jgi:hypothetical protein
MKGHQGTAAKEGPMLISVPRAAYGTIWCIVLLIIAACWTAYAVLSHGNLLFLALALCLSPLLGAGTSLLVRVRCAS